MYLFTGDTLYVYACMDICILLAHKDFYLCVKVNLFYNCLDIEDIFVERLIKSHIVYYLFKYI